MVNNYTPTTEEVRDNYLPPRTEIKDADEQFDRWLAEVKAEAWDEGFTYGETYADNPYRQGEEQ